jgi:hypothetical protein
MNVWLDGVEGDDAQIDAGIVLAKAYPDTIIAVSCGSEIRLRKTRTVAVPVIVGCINRMRAADVRQPLMHQATWPEWCDEETPGSLYPDKCKRWQPVANLVDIIGVTAYLFWENTVLVRFPCLLIQAAPGFHIDRFRETIARYDQPVILTEFGHPGGPPAVIGPCSLNIASESNKLMVASGTLGLLRDTGLPGILFTAYNEPWKAGALDNFEQFWGFCSAFAPYKCVMPGVNGDPAGPSGTVAFGAASPNTGMEDDSNTKGGNPTVVSPGLSPTPSPNQKPSAQPSATPSQAGVAQEQPSANVAQEQPSANVAQEQPSADASNGTQAIIPSFIIGLGIIVFALMGYRLK